jgi:transcriptional regulator with XRE-family HTH domain
MGTPLPACSDARPPLAHLLKGWRTTRKISQLELSLSAGISQRQLSFIESGRARPSRDTVLHLAEALEVPLRERNTLLQAAGFSALYPIRNLDDPLLAAVRDALSLLLERHEPNPALLVDRQTNFLSANRAARNVFGRYGDPRRFSAGVAGTAPLICCASAFTLVACGATFSIGRKWHPSC